MALTRARSGLIVVGNAVCLAHDAHWSAWLMWVDAHGSCVSARGETVSLKMLGVRARASTPPPLSMANSGEEDEALWVTFDSEKAPVTGEDGLEEAAGVRKTKKNGKRKEKKKRTKRKERKSEEEVSGAISEGVRESEEEEKMATRRSHEEESENAEGREEGAGLDGEESEEERGEASSGEGDDGGALLRESRKRLEDHEKERRTAERKAARAKRKEERRLIRERKERRRQRREEKARRKVEREESESKGEGEEEEAGRNANDSREDKEESASLIGDGREKVEAVHVFHVNEIDSDDEHEYAGVDLIEMEGVVAFEASSPLPTIETPPTSPMRGATPTVEEVDTEASIAGHEARSLDDADHDPSVLELEIESSSEEQGRQLGEGIELVDSVEEMS